VQRGSELSGEDEALSEECPICQESAKRTVRQDADYIECTRCGCFKISGTVAAIVSGNLRHDKKSRAKLSHAISKLAHAGRWPLIDSDLIHNIIENTSSPTPLDQLDNLIIWLGSSQDDPGAHVDATPRAISATGAIDYSGLAYVVAEATGQHFVHADIKVIKDLSSRPPEYLISPMRLTMHGWRRFAEIQRGHTSSRRAFMAMQFGISELDLCFRDHFKPAVAATGFNLKRLDEGQPAGLIDDRLRVEIRQSRFLISDLTHRNPGAYWEAGFAEGLGKPVIYTCRKDIFDDKSKGPHFDTNHHLTVVWEMANLDAAMSKLKDTIRATLPDEAVLTD
jgi:hypothetical protein